MNKLTLEQEVTLLRSAVIGLIGRDPEGQYRPEFVDEIFATLTDKPQFTFSTPKEFLAHLKTFKKAA